MRFFGKQIDETGAYDKRIPVPVGDICAYCTEAITAEDSGVVYDDLVSTLHLECHLRGVYGSVAHIEGRCGCFVRGSTEHDPPGLSYREGARAAVKAWERKEKLRVN
jgi:hypothetical protein